MLSKLRGLLYGTAKLLGDVQAIKKGKIGQRIKNRVKGRLLGKLLK